MEFSIWEDGCGEYLEEDTKLTIRNEEGLVVMYHEVFPFIDRGPDLGTIVAEECTECLSMMLNTEDARAVAMAMLAMCDLIEAKGRK